ncbi:MAG: response regulator transcription factor [Bacteroides sp.]|nr:response regulator transcription factor [Bacteroides sp.]
MRDYILADNQDITKAGMLFLLKGVKEVNMILEADNKMELIKALRAYPEAIVILDYTLTDFAGVEELIVLQERFKEARWILFSDELSIDFLRQVILSGDAFSVVMKDSAKEEIISAIQCNIRNERYICNHTSNLLLSSGKPQKVVEEHHLTATEKLILKEIALSKTTKEIAAERNLSFHTVNSHRKNIFRKLEVNSVHEAMKYAMRAGIVDLAEYYI